jgi:hypothetical protein
MRAQRRQWRWQGNAATASTRFPPTNHGSSARTTWGRSRASSRTPGAIIAR